MARMFPLRGPRPGRNSQPLNRAEPKIYEALQMRLGIDAGGHDTGEYIVFHGVKWFAPQSNGGNQPVREMDFLIASRRHGLLIVEAKSAEIALATGRGAKNGNNHHDEIHRAYFKQAKTLEKELAHFLAEAPLTCQHMASYRAGSAVWFPFSQQPWPRDSKATKSVPNTLILDGDDLEDPTAAIERVFAYLGRTNGSATLSDEAIEALVMTLDQATLTMQARLSVRVPGDEMLIQRLTEEQYATLEALSNYPWLEVPGAAGTGKTVLAYEKAFRLAREGKRTLLVCSNPALATWLNEMRARDARPETAYFDVCDLETLCRRAPQQGKLPTPVDADEGPEAVRAGQAITELAKQMRRKREPLYDAILVDEAQDFDQPLWKPLHQLLRNQKFGLFYVFYDLAQRERDGVWTVEMPSRAALMPLVINLRNSQEIFKLVSRFYPERERQSIICKGAQGTPPVYIDPHALSVPGEDPEATALRQALDLLIEIEGIAPQDVLLITCRPLRTSRWNAHVEFAVGEHTIRRDAATAAGKVGLSTIRAARGIERLAVILCELDGVQTASQAFRDKLLYSAVSRAKHKLVVIGSQAELFGEKLEILSARP